MTVENFVRIVWRVFEKIEKKSKKAVQNPFVCRMTVQNFMMQNFTMPKKIKGPFVIFLTSELWKRYIRTLKTLYPNFENVISELWKRYTRTLKTLYPNFENVISELWKRYIKTSKTLYLNFKNVTSELWNVIVELKSGLTSRLRIWTKKWTDRVELTKKN